MSRSSPTPRGEQAPLGRLAAFARRDDGFTLIESVMGMMLFAILATALAGLLQSGIAANGLARQKTVAHQLAQEQVERIRLLDYETEIGTPGGNPNGIVTATQTISVCGVQATMTTQIQWVNDPTPASYSSVANYKRITVTVRSNRDNRVLTNVVTYVSPPGRTALGGLNNAIINVKVQDMGLAQNDLVQGALVQLGSGPSSPLSDTTDANGLVSFPQLVANPTSGPDAYYDITVSKSGYVTYFEDEPPAATAHVQVAPSQTLGPQVVRIYKPATINLAIQNSSGGTYSGATTVKLTSERSGTTQTFSVTGGAQSVTTFGGHPVAPGNFTVRGFTAGGLCADAIGRYVPDDYPTTMSTTYTLQLQACPSGTLVVNVVQLGLPASGATVTVSGGPNDYAPISQVTNGSGQTTFTNLPSGTDAYSISVTKATESATGSAVISTGATTTTNITLPDPPVGDIRALVQWLGANVSGATVTVTGGPSSVNQSLVTGGSGEVTFTNLPSGSGYTVSATKNGQTRTQTGVTVTTSSTTAVTLNMPSGTIAVTATWAGDAAASASVSITGGPDGGTYTGTTNASGQVSINVPATTSSYPYTVTVTKNGGSGAASVTSVTNGGTTAAAVTMGGVGTIAVTATWGGQPAGNVGGTNTITITGGPNSGTYTGTTNASGQVSITVPATTPSYPYTVSASKNGGTGSASVTSVTNGGTTAASIAMTPTKTLNLLIRAGSSNIPNQPVTISLTDGPNGSASASPAYQYVGNTDGSSRVYITVPSQSTGTYTYKIYRTGCPGSSNRSRTGTFSASASTVNVTLSMTSSTCPLGLP